MIKRTLVAMALVLSFLSAQANVPVETYKVNFIGKYQQIAVEEMHRSGIPASITLAQAILESGWGNSKLAIRSNNFFGIKCKSEWTGGKYYHEDDDYDKQGNLVNSCFRVYPSIEASFRDHTNFLVERPYYKDCFQYASNQYIDWAIGLQKCGYATAKDYAVKLIEVIERYGLAKYDMLMTNQAPIVESKPKQDTRIATTTRVHPVPPSPASSTITAPAPYQLPADYRPGMMDRNMSQKSGTVIYRKQLPATENIAMSYQKETATRPKYNRTIGTYKRHLRAITHLPKASNSQRR